MAPTTLNQKVVAWARGKLKQQVGTGQCWDLADRALKHAGAKSSDTTERDADYVWGTPVALKDAIPGDILQFRDFTIVVQTEIDVTFTDGGGLVRDAQDKQVRPHHTAIVDAVLGDGVFVILEQHVKPLGDKVQRHTIRTKPGKLPPKSAFKPAKDLTGKLRPAKVVEQVTVLVEGNIWAYRPIAH